MTKNGRFQTILPCKGSSRETRVSLELAEGQTEGYPPLDSVTPLHHFVVPLPLQGRNLQPLLVESRPTHIRHAGLDPASRFSMPKIKKRPPAQACPEPVEGAGVTMAASDQSTNPLRGRVAWGDVA